MGKPHPMELRQRVVDHVFEGNTHRTAAARFRVSVKFVNDMVKPQRLTGCLAPRSQGNGGGQGKLSGLKDWVARRIGRKPDLTAAELAAWRAVGTVCDLFTKASASTTSPPQDINPIERNTLWRDLFPAQARMNRHRT